MAAVTSPGVMAKRSIGVLGSLEIYGIIVLEKRHGNAETRRRVEGHIGFGIYSHPFYPYISVCSVCSVV